MRLALLALLALGANAFAEECWIPVNCASAACRQMTGGRSRLGPYSSRSQCQSALRSMNLASSCSCGAGGGASGGGAPRVNDVGGAAGALLGAGMTNSMQGAQVGAALGSAFFQGLNEAQRAQQQRLMRQRAEAERLRLEREAQEAREADERHGRLMGQLKGAGGGLKLKTSRDVSLRDHTIKHVDELAARREALAKLKGKPVYEWCLKNFTKLREPTRPIYEVAGEYERQWKQYRRAARDWDNKCDGPSAQPGYVEPGIPGADVAKKPEPAPETPKSDDGPTIGGLKLKTAAREQPKAEGEAGLQAGELKFQEPQADAAPGRPGGGLNLKKDIGEFETVNPGGQAAPDVSLDEDEKASDRSQDGLDRPGRLGALGKKPDSVVAPETGDAPAPRKAPTTSESRERRAPPPDTRLPPHPEPPPIPKPVVPDMRGLEAGALVPSTGARPKRGSKQPPAGCDFDYRKVARAIGIEEEIRAKAAKPSSEATLKALRSDLSIADHETACSSKAGRCFVDEDPLRLASSLQRANLVAPRGEILSCGKGQFTDSELYFLRKRAQKAGRPLVVTGGLTDTGVGLARRYQAICTRNDAQFKPFRHKKLYTGMIDHDCPDLDIWHASINPSDDGPMLYEERLMLDKLGSFAMGLCPGPLDERLDWTGYSMKLYPAVQHFGYRYDEAQNAGAMVIHPNAAEPLRIPARWQSECKDTYAEFITKERMKGAGRK